MKRKVAWTSLGQETKLEDAYIAKRKQHKYKLEKLYWLISAISKLSIDNKLLVYKN